MQHLALALSLVVGLHVAHASEEEIHRWKQVALVADAGSFGDVEVRATAAKSGDLASLTVGFAGKTIVVPDKWIQSLPPMAVSSVEVRSERGYDPTPWLYVVFRIGTNDHIHIAFHNGKLDHALITRSDAKGALKSERRPAP